VVTPENQHRIFEVHPEVSFHALSVSLGGDGTLAPKKTFTGAMQRLRMLEASGVSGVSAILEGSSALGAAEDDVLDAAVAAWTAQRKVSGNAQCHPAQPEFDARGLRMEIWA